MMGGTFNDEARPNIVFKDGNMHDVVPIELRIYDGLERRYFKTFSEALDEYFGRITLEKARIEQTKKLEARKRALLMTLRKQEEMLRGGFEEGGARANQEIGDLIYANYAFIERLLEEFRKATERLGWDGFKRRMEEGRKAGNKVALMVKGGMDPAEKAVTLELEGKRVKLYLERSVGGENAALYYEKAKKFRHKHEGGR